MKHIKQLHNAMLLSLRAWLPLAVIITAVFLGIYFSSQYIVRSLAVEEQVKISADVMRYLNEGGNPMALNANAPVDIEKTLSPYIVFYTLDILPMTSSVTLDGERPILPFGVYAQVKERGEHRLTWQPKRGLRQAIVLNHLEGPTPGYLLVGKSLKESERTICGLWYILSVMWAITMLGSFFVVSVVNKKT